MFSVEYYNRTVIITAYNVRRINFRYQDQLKKLMLQAMKQLCHKIVLNLAGVRTIDCSAYEMLKLMAGMTSNLGITLSLMNLDHELIHQIQSSVDEIADCVPNTSDAEALSEMMA